MVIIKNPIAICNIGVADKTPEYLNKSIQVVTEEDLDGITSVGYNAFRDCDSLTDVTIPNTATSIETYAFMGCTNLESVTVLRTQPPTLYEDAFRNTNNQFLIYVPDESLTAYKTASQWSNYSSRIFGILASQYPDFTWSGTTITGYTGSDTNVVIPEGCTAIAEGVFDGSSQSSIQISSTVTSIGDRNFYDCGNLTTIKVLATTPPELPQATKDFFPSIFSKSDNLTAIYVPSSSVSAYQAAPTWSWESSIIQAIPE